MQGIGAPHRGAEEGDASASSVMSFVSGLKFKYFSNRRVN